MSWLNIDVTMPITNVIDIFLIVLTLYFALTLIAAPKSSNIINLIDLLRLSSNDSPSAEAWR